jgi:adenylate cyclase
MERRKKKLIRGGLGFLVIGLIFAILQSTAIFKSFEEKSLDLRYRFFNYRSQIHEDVIVIDFDEETLKDFSPEYGQWPWPRRVYKDVIEFVNMGSPATIIFDIFFTEEHKNDDGDTQLAEITKLSPNVSHALLLLPDIGIEGKDFIEMPEETKARFNLNWLNQDTNSKDKVSIYKNFAPPMPSLLQSSHLLHVVSVAPDSDGILRRIPLLIPYGSDYLPSLALRGILSKAEEPRLALADNKILVFDKNKLKWQIPLDEKSYLPLHFYTSETKPKNYRASEIIRSQKKIQAGETDVTLDPEVFKGKIIIIGTSAIGLNDLKVTPLGQQYPGVFLHATGISNVLQNDYLARPGPVVILLCTLLIILLIELFLFSFDSFYIRNIVPPAILLAYLAIAIFSFSLKSFYLPLANPLIFGFIALLDGYIYISLIEGKARRKMESALSKYLSPNVTKHLISSGVDPTAEVGSSKELTVLFSDLRGFTTLSEKMEPASLVHLLNEYLSKMTDIVFDHDGTLDKFIGDAVMAFWGAPLDDAEHSRNAVKTALHMVRELEKLNEKWQREGLPQLKVGIGVLTGNVIVGNIGGAKRLDYTVIGDNVNTTSRLEGLTKEYGCKIIIAESTYNKVQHFFVTRIMDMVVAKGKTKAVKIFEPLIEKGQGPNVTIYENLARKFNAAWEMYAKGNFKDALSAFQQLEREFPDDDSTKVYIERCNDLILNPPDEWTGVFIATRK